MLKPFLAVTAMLVYYVVAFGYLMSISEKLVHFIA